MNKYLIPLALILIFVSPAFAEQCKSPEERFTQEVISATIDYYIVREATHKIYYELFFTYFKMGEKSKNHELGQEQVDYYMGEFRKAIESYLDQSTNKEIVEAWENGDIGGYIKEVGKKVVENIPVIGDVYNTLSFLETTMSIYDAAETAPQQITGIANEFQTMQFHEVYTADARHYLDSGYFTQHLKSTRDYIEKYPTDYYKIKQRFEEELTKIQSLKDLTSNAIGEPDVWESTSFESVTDKLYEYLELLEEEEKNIKRFLKMYIPPDVEYDISSRSLFYPEEETLNLTAAGYEFNGYSSSLANKYIWGYKDPTFGYIKFSNENTKTITLKKDYPIAWNFDRDYIIWVRAVSEDGVCSGIKEHKIRVKQVIPNNSITFEPRPERIPLKVKFTSTVKGENYHWFIGETTFGEYQGPDKQSIEHTFYVPGIYDIILKVESGDQEYDFSTTIELMKRLAPAMLDAKFDKSEVTKGEPVTLKIDISYIPNDAGTPAPDVESIKYECKLDEVTVRTETYTDYDKTKLDNNIRILIDSGTLNAGDYKCTVDLKTEEDAYNSVGYFSVTTPILNIKPNLAAPSISIRAKSATTAGFSVEGEAPFTVEFEELKIMKIAGIKRVEFDKDGDGIFEFKKEFKPALQYQYDLIAEEGPQIYTFTTPGIYKPKLKGTDENGLTGERYITVTVTAPEQNASKTFDQDEDDNCTDSDNGKNYDVKGITQSEDPEMGTHLIKDFCQVGDLLVEGYCLNGEATSITHTCQYGCGGGVCLQQPTDITTKYCAGFDWTFSGDPTICGTKTCSSGTSCVPDIEAGVCVCLTPDTCSWKGTGFETCGGPCPSGKECVVSDSPVNQEYYSCSCQTIQASSITCDTSCKDLGYDTGKCNGDCNGFDYESDDASSYCEETDGVLSCCCFYEENTNSMTQQECAEYTATLGYEHSMIDTNCAEYANAYCQNSVGHSQSVVYQEQNCCIWNC